MILLPSAFERHKCALCRIFCYHFCMRCTVSHSRHAQFSAKMTVGIPFRTLALAVLLVLCFFSRLTLQQQGTAAGQKAVDSALGLYDTIRSIASPGTAVNNANLDSRFILMMPGKVLNYQDYHPGPEYTEFVQVS